MEIIHISESSYWIDSSSRLLFVIIGETISRRVSYMYIWSFEFEISLSLSLSQHEFLRPQTRRRWLIVSESDRRAGREKNNKLCVPHTHNATVDDTCMYVHTQRVRVVNLAPRKSMQIATRSRGMRLA